MEREHTFEMLEHTADVGVVGFGETMAEAFENVAYGMFSVMAELDCYQATEKTTVEVTGEDEVDLLQSFLATLVVLMDADGVLPLGFHVIKLEGGQLACEVAFRPIGDDIEWLGPAVKAVTYHQMAVQRENAGWRAQAIFDV